jgi:hypothetical protein
MFLVLSLICSSLNELLANLVNSRANTLKSAIESLLSGGGAAPAGGAPGR